MTELTLRSGTDYNFAHINIGRFPRCVRFCVMESPDTDVLFSPRALRKRDGLRGMMLVFRVVPFFQTGRIVSGVFLLHLFVPILR
jgi:hypothetical protein